LALCADKAIQVVFPGADIPQVSKNVISKELRFFDGGHKNLWVFVKVRI
jgi:hypothetical protein